MSRPPVPRFARLQEFLERLRSAPRCASGEAAKRLLDETLNRVEDEFTDIPFDPERWRTDGRMYPAQEDNAADVEGYPDVTSYRHRSHETLICANGAFEIRDVLTKDVVLAKAGADGKGVWS